MAKLFENNKISNNQDLASKKESGSFYPIFLSIVLMVQNDAQYLKGVIEEVTSLVSSRVGDYELIIVDNGSNDETLSILRILTGSDGLPNLQIFSLTKEVDIDSAFWVGLENSLGDFVVMLDPMVDDISHIPSMLDYIANGADVVFAQDIRGSNQSLTYRLLQNLFNLIYQKLNGINLQIDAPQYRLLSRKVINFILQHSRPNIAYRHLPITGGFERVNIQYKGASKFHRSKHVGEAINRAMYLMASTTNLPMRIVTSFCILGAASNFLYTLYVVIIAIFKENVAAGWVSLSLQQSGMFFLISLVLLVLAEYILNIATASNNSPPHHIAHEFTSTHITRHEKLNIELAASKISASPIIEEKNLSDL